MGKIKRLELENFQSHNNTLIEFGDGMTVILGPTDQGKSAIIRALKWVLYNEPRGSDFISAGESYCRVKLTLEDDTQIIREKGINRNRYILIKNGKEEIFEGFGNTVPVEIYKAHGIPKIKIDKDAVSFANLSEQLEGPFLLSENAATRARILGKLAGIHVIDAALKLTNKELNEYISKEKAILSRLEELDKKLEDFKDLDVIKNKLETLNDLIELLKGKQELLKVLKDFKERLQYIYEEEKKLIFLVNNLETLDKAEELIKSTEEKAKFLKSLIDVRKKIYEVKTQYINVQKILKNTKDVFIAEQVMMESDKKFEEYKKLKDISLKLDRLEKEKRFLSLILEKTKEIKNCEDLTFSAEENYKRLKNLTEIKNKLINLTKDIKQLEEKIIYINFMLKSEDYLKDVEKKKELLDNLKRIKEEIKANENKIKEEFNSLRKIEDCLYKESQRYIGIMKKLAKCPICFNPIDEKQVEKISTEILRKEV